MAGQQRPTTSRTEGGGSLVVSALGKTVFPEGYPGSGVRRRLAREEKECGGHCCSSSCLIHRAHDGSGEDKFCVQEGQEGLATYGRSHVGTVTEAGTLGQLGVGAPAWLQTVCI